MDRHPLEADPLHLREAKGLWEAWQIDYIGPFQRSQGKYYVLVRVEIVSRLVKAKACAKVTEENTIKALKEWFGIVPKPVNPIR